MRNSLILLSFILSFNLSYAQNEDSLAIRKIYDEALISHIAYKNLEYLSLKIGSRLSGSNQLYEAIKYTQQLMKIMGLDTVYLQEVKIPHWIRGDKEICKITSLKSGTVDLDNCSLGGSIGTGDHGISAGVVEVTSLKQLKELGSKEIAGKIVFFNQVADPRHIITFQAYGEVAYQRVSGAIEASKLGAVAVIVRSLTPSHDNFPHTGIMAYDSTVKKIPAFAVSTNSADKLSELISSDKNASVYVRNTSKWEVDTIGYNVIGELKGTKYPDQIITVGGHLDSWYLGHGATDDGVGSMEAIEVLRIYKTSGVRPQRTVRAVMFMDEEIHQSGGRKYAELAVKNKEKLYFAVESDEGAAVPVGFSLQGTDQQLTSVKKYEKILRPYGIYFIEKGYGGVDLQGLNSFKIPLISLVPDNSRYFDFHHSPNDTFDKVNEREMQLGSAAIASLIYIIDKSGY
jgi:carboxypeptidase Q